MALPGYVAVIPNDLAVDSQAAKLTWASPECPQEDSGLLNAPGGSNG